MHRRGNKSKKVPNVRLRPAHPDAMVRARASPEHTSCWVDDSQIVGSDDTIMVGGSCPRPFKNVVVCATGVVDKPALFKLALELGATSVSAFTDRVTHLVAENHGGPKYLCALDRKIPILLPSWITESHRVWQHGDDVDLAQSVETHRLPVFSGVTLCISGISEILRRTQINKALTAQGGTYVKALERPVRVTHLLCSGEDETDKMRYADKFNRAGEADPPIQLVWEEWFWDCLEFGGRFDEARYQARLPRPERRITEVSPLPEVNPARSGPAPTAHEDDNDDEDELVPVQRLPAVTLQLWGSLLKARGYEVSRAGVMLSPKKAREMAIHKRDEPKADAVEGSSGSVLSSFRRANSYAAPRTTAAAAPRMLREPSCADAGPSRPPFVRGANATGSGGTCPSSPRAKRLREEEETNAAPAPNTRLADEPPATVFAGLRFVLRGETDTATVRGAIEGAGGVVTSTDVDADYVIVRLVSGSALYFAEPSSSARSRYRTECWLEHCLFADQLCEPSVHVSFVPISVRLPIPGAEHITLSFSGLEVSEACWVRRLLKALGITLAPAFSRHTTHLLCPNGTGAKYTRARQWGVPVVNMGWLSAMVKHGSVPDVHAFLVLPAEGTAGDVDVVAHVPNGKGKEKAEDTMQDITNSYDSHGSQPKQETFCLPPLPPARPSFGEPGPALAFGQPDISLGQRSSSLHEPPATPSPPKRPRLMSTPSRSRPTTPLALIAHAVPVPTQNNISTSGRFVQRAATVGAVERVRQESHVAASSSPARVPSSSSPSPLRRGVSVSPSKIPEERTKALQESITSLLGKRVAAPEEDTAPGRAGKRGRAHRSKPQSRQPSDLLPIHAPITSELGTFGGGRSLSLGPDDSAYEGLSIGADEQSMQVMYEDPGQREERMRLASLIGEPLEGDGAGLRKRPRRSTRRG
ncbi:hypothetical protein B0H15DRAFT_861404 [Mycena belliarum]|uniref:BRCT domain-containing protein n=1 Tax=Mycena belliarum TaxID=1033014 RepID=A0AAD6TUL6_9AGAR|nr:hypothetical protein B0H15DRAFT_861404 [Mycena belliae]